MIFGLYCSMAIHLFYCEAQVRASPEQLTERCDGTAVGDLQVNTLRLQEAWSDAICGPNEPEFFAVGDMVLGGYDIDLFVNLERSFGRDNRLDLSFYSIDPEESEELVPVDTVELEPIEPMEQRTLYARLNDLFSQLPRMRCSADTR